MKSKAPLALIELVIMILIFALAAGLCLKAFFWSHQQSEQIALRDEAALAVQNAAELIKSSKGDMTVIESLKTADTNGFALQTEVLDVNTAGLGSALITAATSEGKEIFALQVFWQEPHEGGGGHE